MGQMTDLPVFVFTKGFSTDRNNWVVLNVAIAIKGMRKVQEVPQSQTAALPRPQEEEETDKSKQAQTEQTYEKN